MINHHYAISPSFHSCCRVFCDIEWSLSQKGIYVSLHGWIIAKCVQKKLWTFDWGGWIYCNDSMNADVFNFDFHFSNFQDWLLRQGGFCPLPPTPWTPPPPLAYIVPFQFPSCNHGIHPQQLKRVTSRMHQLLPPSLLPTKCSQNTVIIELKKQDIPTFTNFPGPPRPIYTGSKATRPTQKRRKVAVLFMARHESSLKNTYITI